MFRCATAAVLAVLASVPFAVGADKAKKPTGVWTHTVNDVTVTLTFMDDTFRTEIANSSGASMSADGSYGVTADGLVFGVITKVEKKGIDEGPDKGTLFSFQGKVDGDTLSLNDLNSSTGVSDTARQLLQGDYKKKK
ncbi:MAG TPA: hypothetical protein VMS17_11800 [Gemmataceae bacterium]|nr:hypothetical protein [Gemmataceae bacterium]